MICRNCQDSFPPTMVIDGKRRVLNKRRYCLRCSPFGRHQTKPMLFRVDKKMPRTCEGCSRQYIWESRRGHTFRKCNSCVANGKRKNARITLITKAGGKCVSCGYKKCIDALEFHHRDPREKDFNVNGSTGCMSIARLLREIKKCDLLCANCHREKHFQINKSSRSSRLAEHLLDKRGVAGAAPAETTIAGS